MTGFIFYGDSISAILGSYADGVCVDLNAVKVNSSGPHPAAIGGTCLVATGGGDNGMFGYESRVYPYAYDACIIEYGRNDIDWLSTYYPNDILTLWSYAWDVLLSQFTRWDNLIALGIPFPPNHPLSLWQAMDTVCYNKCVGRAGMSFVSLQGMTAAMIGADGIHPNANGMQYIRGLVDNALHTKGF